MAQKPKLKILDSNVKAEVKVPQAETKSLGVQPAEKPGRCVRTRKWVFTCNNPSETHKSSLEGLTERGLHFLGYQLERGKSGTLHYQGFVHFQSAATQQQVRKYLPGFHLEPQRGSDTDNMKYCCNKDKEGFVEGPWILGELGPGQGKRTDLQDLINFLDEGHDLLDCKEKYPTMFLKFHKHIETYIRAKRFDPFIEYPVKVWHVDTRAEASKLIKDRELPKAFLADNEKWWDHYQQEETVILDGKHSDYIINAVKSPYCFTVNMKGDSSYIRPKYVIIIRQDNPSKLQKSRLKQLTADDLNSPEFQELLNSVKFSIYPKEGK